MKSKRENNLPDNNPYKKKYLDTSVFFVYATCIAINVMSMCAYK